MPCPPSGVRRLALSIVGGFLNQPRFSFQKSEGKPKTFFRFGFPAVTAPVAFEKKTSTFGFSSEATLNTKLGPGLRKWKSPGKSGPGTRSIGDNLDD